jgi:hypothetical protein
MDKILQQAKFWQFDEKSIFPFGKYKGKTILQVFEEQPSYIVYCIKNIKQFALMATAWNKLYEIDNRLLNSSESVVSLLGKQFEVNRILRENTHLDDSNNHDNSYFSRKVVFINEDKFVIKTKFSTNKKKFTDESGKEILVSKIHHSLSHHNNNVISSEINNIYFSIDVVDVKDIAQFRKYSSKYSEGSCRIFEAVKRIPCGLVALIISMNYKNFQIESAPFGGDDIIRILPDDAECALYIIKHALTKDGLIGERNMTQAEIEAAVLAANEHLRKMQEEGQNNPDFWDNYEYDDLTAEDYAEKKISEYGPVDNLEKFLECYSLNRKAFPDANLLRTTSLQYHAHEMQFHLHTDEIDLLMKQWYEENQNIKEYEFRMHKAWQMRRDYWRWHNESMSEEETDYEREAWEELTDGQDGDWEDWHDSRD